MKKGFTLIELLAVILILGIISLIAIPIVSEILYSAKQLAFMQKNKVLVNLVSKECSVRNVNNKSKLSGLYSIDNKKIFGLDLDYSGDLPDNGYFTVNDSCEVSLATYNDDFCVTKEEENETFDSKKFTSSSDCIINNTLINETKEETKFIYDVKGDGTIEIVGYNYDPSNKDIVIPSTIDNKLVTKIDDFTFTKSDIRVISYYSNDYLTESLYEDFTGNEKDILFYHSFSNSDVTGKKCIKGTYPNFVYNDVDMHYNLTPGDGYSYCRYTTSLDYGKYNEIKINSIDFSKAVGIKEIPDALAINAGLTSINLGNNIKKIGYSAFTQNNITSVDFPTNIEIINANAFSNNKISKTNIENTNIKHLGKRCFIYNSIESVIFPESLTYVGDFTFSANNLKTIKMSNNKDIEYGYNIFSHNNNIQSLTMPSFWTEIPSNLLGYIGMDTLVISGNIKKLNENAFYGSSIKHLVLEEGVQEIGPFAFYYGVLETVSFPNSLTKIGNDAFGINSLKSIDIKDNVKTIGNNAFRQNKINTIQLGGGITSIGSNVFLGNAITSFKINKSSTIGGSPWGANKYPCYNTNANYNNATCTG